MLHWWGASGDEILFCPEGSEWTRREDREHLLLEGGLPPILITDMGRSLVLRVCFLSAMVVLERVIDGTLHSLLQLNVIM